MTEAELQEIEVRANAASPPPWTPDPERHVSLDWGLGVVVLQAADGEYVSITPYPDWPEHAANIAFIAAARTDVPGLLAEVRRLRAALDFSRIGSVTADPCFVDGCTRYGWPITAGADGAPPRVYACRGHLEQGCRSLQLPVVVVWVRELGPVRCREFGGRWHTETAIGLWETRPQRREATGDAL